MLASDYPFLDVVRTFVVFFFFFLTFLWLLVKVVADIFRSGRWGATGKTLWTIFVILIPIGGAFYYLLVRVLGDLRPAEARRERRIESVVDPLVHRALVFRPRHLPRLSAHGHG